MNKEVDQLELICKKNKIKNSNSNKEEKFNYPKNILLGNKSERLDDIIVNYKNSLVLDIWIFLFNKV